MNASIYVRKRERLLRLRVTPTRNAERQLLDAVYQLWGDERCQTSVVIRWSELPSGEMRPRGLDIEIRPKPGADVTPALAVAALGAFGAPAARGYIGPGDRDVLPAGSAGALPPPPSTPSTPPEAPAHAQV